jgi:6-phosphogluconolactonase/glucosamine-6-phosphate isomerase/deaminase
MINDWAVRSAKALIEKIELVLTEKDKCNVLLTDGNSSYKPYSQLACDLTFNNLNNLNFYLSDEECVDIGHPDSNCKMAGG